MDKKDQKTKLRKKDVEFILFHQPSEDVEFVPWGRGEQGEQTYLKFKKGQKTAYLYSGEKTMVEPEIQKFRMKLINDGWNLQGEVNLEFDGRTDQEKETDELFHRDVIRIEIGRKLLPLVDPGAGAPLMEVVSELRKEIARSTGFVTPGIRVSDNMNIPYDSYVIYLKETPIASGEIFLDRFLVMGSMEQLNQLKGWSVKDPAFGNPSLWIEPDKRAKAEELGCMIMGPLNVLVTHLRESVERNLRQLLGLQDVYRMLQQLKKTHPIVVEGFIENKKKLRAVRKILQNLAAERVSIRDLVTIMETIGDYEDQIQNTDMITEMVRIELARQICWSYIDPEGKITALSLSAKLEEKIQNSIKKTRHGLRLVMTEQEADELIRQIRKTLKDFKYPRVIFCDPPSRLYFRRLTMPVFPNIGVLSTAEIAPGIHVEVVGEIQLPSETSKESFESSKEQNEKEKEKKEGGLFGFIKS